MEAYRERCPAGWASGPNDGYFFQHLCRHLIELEHWDEVVNVLTGFDFLMAKTKANIVEGILGNYGLLWERSPETLKEQLGLWRAFFTERAHILRRGTAEWPAYKIFLQLAVEHADHSPVTIGAERWLEEGRCDWPWLRRTQRLPHAGKSPCLAVLEGHTHQVYSALETKDGRFLSWSEDHTLRLWDQMGRGLYSCAIDEGLCRFPEFRLAHEGKENYVSRSLLRVMMNSGFLTVFSESCIPRLFWHGESKCSAPHLKPEGLAILTQQNGQVCFLRIYHRNKPISVEELERLHGP